MQRRCTARLRRFASTAGEICGLINIGLNPLPAVSDHGHTVHGHAVPNHDVFSNDRVVNTAAAAERGAPNLRTLAPNDLVSTRRIQSFDEFGNRVGDIEISGRIRKVDATTYRGDTVLTGFYTGPMDLELCPGYVLPLRPIIGGRRTTLFGEVDVDIFTSTGTPIRTHHEQTYSFDPPARPPDPPDASPTPATHAFPPPVTRTCGGLQGGAAPL